MLLSEVAKITGAKDTHGKKKKTDMRRRRETLKQAREQREGARKRG